MTIRLLKLPLLSLLEEADKPADALIWPARAFEDQPLLLLQKHYRDLASQLGSLGVVARGVASVISPTSTASEQVTLEPLVSLEVSAPVAEMDAVIP